MLTARWMTAKHLNCHIMDGKGASYNPERGESLRTVSRQLIRDCLRPVVESKIVITGHGANFNDLAKSKPLVKVNH